MPKLKEWETHSGVVLDSVKGFDVIDCESCAFKHIIPIPSEAELASVYRNDYYAMEKPLYLERHRQDLEWWTLAYSERYDTFEQHLPRDRRRILDVGSGPGFFLLQGKQRGWETLGFEPSIQAAAHSRNLGLQIIDNFLNKENVAGLGAFDVVHMSEVLEHIADPELMLRLAHSLLTVRGLLCVVVPNDYNPFQTALRKECGYAPWWVAPPHHINYFDPVSLERLFTRSGFEVVERSGTFPIDLFLLLGHDYIDNDDVGRRCHSQRMVMEKTLAAAGLSDLKKRWYRGMASIGLGREVIVYGRAIPLELRADPTR